VADGYIGQRRPGLSNRRLSQGRGAYVADIELDGMLHVAVLRSPHASARIVSIDAGAARALPGVRYVVTGEEIRRHTQPIPEGWDTSTIGARGVVWYALCLDRVRYVGEAVAAVAAEDRWQAERALSAIEVDYEVLPAVTDPVAALEPGAPLVEPEWGTNLRVARDLRIGDVAAARQAADGVVEGSLRVHRTTGVPIEPRGIVASWDQDEELLSFWDSTQNPHPLRLYLSQTIGLPESQIRVIQPQVGGAFGLKQPTFQEEPLLAYLALRLGRPVRWIEERHESFLCTGHARDMLVDYRASYLEDGTVTGLELAILADVGAPTSLVGWGMSISASGIVPGPYRIPNTRVRLRSVVTNKGPWNSYRGFGRDAANWWLERILDQVAGRLGMDRAEVRLRNFIGPDEFPFSREGGGIIDSGDYPASLRHALELIGYQEFASERARARAEGRFLGIGIGNELGSEGCAMPGSVMISAFDGATVRMSPSGEVTVLSGVTSPGGGNETGLAQIVADTIGCELERVSVIQGDTQVCPWGLGNYSSRGIIIGGSAAELAAADLRDKLLTVAGNLLEASPEDLEIARGRVSVRGAPQRFVPVAEVANEIYTRPYGANFYTPGPSGGARRGGRARSGGDPLLPGAEHLPPAGDPGPLQRLPDLAERHRRLRGRGRPGHGHGPHPAPLRGRRLRDSGQPHTGRGQPARRHRAGDRRRAVRADRLRPVRPAPDRDADGLHHPDRAGGADDHGGARAQPVAVHAARHQGGRRVRHGLRPGRADQRDRGRAAGPAAAAD
jgi:carbon-monoxide dehydrogenase large subunit